MLLLLEVAGMRERRGTGRRRRDGCRRRTKGLGLGRWRSGRVVAEVGRRRSAAADDMAAVVGDRLGGESELGWWVGNGVAWWSDVGGGSRLWVGQRGHCY